jgi:TetR/AcrR family transcriptional regulator, transcriptional repressor for nem operon
MKPKRGRRRAPKPVERAGAEAGRGRRAPRFAESNLRRQQQRTDAKRVTRQTLLDAGLEEIIKHGLDVGLDAICARAGYTRGAFYVHFKNREEFLLAITENVLHAIVDATVTAETQGGVASSIERFAEALEAGAWPLVPKIRVATVRMMDAIDRWPAIRAAFDRFLTVAIERLIRFAAREQAIGHVRRDVAPDELAIMLVTMAIGTIMLTSTGIRTERGKRRALLIRLIRPPETVPSD